MNIRVDPTSSNLASAMLNLKIRPRAVVGYGVKIFHPSPTNYVTRSPGGDLKHSQPNVVAQISIRAPELLKPELEMVFSIILIKYANHLRMANRGLIICNKLVWICETLVYL